MNQEISENLIQQEAIKAARPLNILIISGVLYILSFPAVFFLDTGLSWDFFHVVLSAIGLIGLFRLFKLNINKRYERSISLTLFTSLVMFVADIIVMLGPSVLSDEVLSVIFQIIFVYAIFLTPFHFIRAMVRLCEAIDMNNLSKSWFLIRIVILVFLAIIFGIYFWVQNNLQAITLDQAMSGFIFMWVLAFIPSFVMIYGISFTRKALLKLQTHIDSSEVLA